MYREGFLNVDRDRRASADLVADAACLPLRPRACARIEAYHLLEHLGYCGAVFALPEWFRVLAPGGVLVLETPDIDGSFRAFLAARTAADRARELGWIFGEETEGLQHRVLFPPDLLEDLLHRAGFEDLRREPPRSWRGEPGLRMEARRMESPAHEALAALKARVRSGRWIRTDRQTEVVEFENQFARNAALAMAGERVEACLSENVVFCPRGAAVWLSEAMRRDVFEEAFAQPLRDAAAALDALAFPARLFAAFLRRAEGPPAGEDGYEAVLATGLGVLADVLAGTKAEEALDAAGLGLAPPAPGPLYFGKVQALEEAGALRDRGVRLFARDRFEEAERALQASAALGVDPLYPWWNLAALHAARGELERAATDYARALAGAPHALRGRVAGDFAACLLRLERFEEAAALVAEHAGVPDRETLHDAALAGMRLGSPPAKPPALRTRPVPASQDFGEVDDVEKTL